MSSHEYKKNTNDDAKIIQNDYQAKVVSPDETSLNSFNDCAEMVAVTATTAAATIPTQTTTKMIESAIVPPIQIHSNESHTNAEKKQNISAEQYVLDSIQLNDQCAVVSGDTLASNEITTATEIEAKENVTKQLPSPPGVSAIASAGTIGVASTVTHPQTHIENVLSVENERLNGTDGNSTTSAKYTSLVMITQDIRASTAQVSVVPTDTTHIVSDDSIIVRHTNRLSDDEYESNSFSGYFMRSLEEDSLASTPITKRRPIVTNHSVVNSVNNEKKFSSDDSYSEFNRKYGFINNQSGKSDENGKQDNVTVVTGTDTLSAVVGIEDGLADDDSWVEEFSGDEEEFATTTGTESEVESAEELTLCSTIDREEELRGYNRSAIDFTLHTIVEESCEESEIEINDKRKNRMSASELEKYFFFGLCDGKPSVSNTDNREDSLSDTSSLCSEGLDSLGAADEQQPESNHLASSRLEKYFLSTFMGFSNERGKDSDGSGSVGSDSEGHASPEQRRKRLVRARGTPRSHNSSLDNLLAAKDDSHELNSSAENPNDSNNSSSETDTCDETVIHLEKVDNPNDTLKRKKQNKKRSSDSEENRKSIGASDDEIINPTKLSQTDFSTPSANPAQNKKQCRDSGFIGSNDDLLKSDETPKVVELKTELEEIKEDVKESLPQQSNLPPSSTLTRKDSFNNWSSDEETNLMMSKMRQFFKTLVASNANAQPLRNASKSSTPLVSESNTPKTGTPVPRPRASKSKPPQLVYFENELTRLMKTVPGINDDQVREIVEYLSSEETWSDSYDSSDYTSSDLEGAGAASSTNKSELQEQISASCQQIIKNFESSVIGDKEGDMGDGGLFEESQGLNRETALVYQKLVASFSKISNSSSSNETQQIDSKGSPPIFAKVMSHIGTRLVALMHEVSSGESHTSQSPKAATRYHKKLQQKISATTTDDDDSTSDRDFEKTENLAYLNLPRSKSHDLLLSGSRPQHHQSSSGVSDTAAEEKEASDYERFSWRGSFESALLANGDSRTKLTLLDRDNSTSASALAAKRRSAGDLLFNQRSLSREQLDRVRSCGSIGGNTNEHDDIEVTNLWATDTSQRTSNRRSSVPHAGGCDTNSSSSDDDEPRLDSRSTLPRSLQTTSAASTNSLPRLTTSNVQAQMQKSQSAYQFLPNSVKSARYRAPGFNRTTATIPKKSAASSLGLSSLYAKRDTTRTRRIQTIYNGKIQ